MKSVYVPIVKRTKHKCVKCFNAPFVIAFTPYASQNVSIYVFTTAFRNAFLWQCQICTYHKCADFICCTN